MTITFKTIFAWALIFIGLGLIFWDISTSYNYFTGKLEFPPVFAAPATQTTDKSSSGQITAEQLAGNIIKDQMNEMLSPEKINIMLNMTAWILFASFLIYAGGKIVGIGNDFLKS
jgi:hypothetical protein